MVASKSFESKYKKTHTLEFRLRETERLRKKNPARLAVICEKMDDSDIGDIKEGKFLMPYDLTVGQFVMVLRKRLQLNADEAIFVFVGGSVPPNTAQMSDLYTRFKDEDGFLYLKYSGESTFGGSAVHHVI